MKEFSFIQVAMV